VGAPKGRAGSQRPLQLCQHARWQRVVRHRQQVRRRSREAHRGRRVAERVAEHAGRQLELKGTTAQQLPRSLLPLGLLAQQQRQPLERPAPNGGSAATLVEGAAQQVLDEKQVAFASRSAPAALRLADEPAAARRGAHGLGEDRHAMFMFMFM
jgi:hypothetical protein